jgi:hypothetical protein
MTDICRHKIHYRNILAEPDVEVTVDFPDYYGMEWFNLFDGTDFTVSEIKKSVQHTYSVRNFTGNVLPVRTLTFYIDYLPTGNITITLNKIGESDEELGVIYSPGLYQFEVTNTNFDLSNGETLNIKMDVVSSTDEGCYINQMFVGDTMIVSVIDGTTDHADFQGTKPLTLCGNINHLNTISVNGNFIGRQIKPEYITGTISQNYVTRDWVYNTWNDFAKSAVKRPFFLTLNYLNHANDIAFCSATNISTPVNSGPGEYMEVSMNYQGINRRE